MKYTTGPGARWSVSADFNSDGKADLAVAAQSYISILFGNGDGTFQPQNSSTAGAYTALLALDFNGDAKTDLVTPNGVLLGNGNGTFQPIPAPLDSPGATTLAVADMNGDGRLDLITSGPAGLASLIIRTSNGSGGWTQTFNVPWEFALYSQPLMADFNRDGKVDLAYTAKDGSLMMALGNGNGTLQNPVTILPPTYMGGSSAAYDFNGDGKIDLAQANSTNIRIVRGNGDGTFQPPTILGLGDEGFFNVVDLNQDGRQDIFIGYTYYLGQGGGAFAAPAFWQAVKMGSAPGNAPLAQIGFGDFNRDGWLDISSSSGISGNTVSVYLSTGPAEYQQFPVVGVNASARWAAQATGDFNRDGLLDAVTVTDGRVTLWAGKGDGTFRPPVDFPTLIESGRSVRTGDFNRDGKADLLIGGYRSSSSCGMQVVLGGGDGTFIARPEVKSLLCPVYAMTTADLNGDGKLDAVSSGGEIWLGDGSGGFSAHSFGNLSSYHYPTFVTTADFNRDNIPDLAFTISPVSGSGDPALLLLFQGVGDSSFRPPTVIPIGVAPSCITTADLNGDSKVDLVVGDQKTSQLFTFLGNGDGTFQSPRTTGGTGGPVRVVPADMDGDSILDLVVADQSVSDVVILPGRGDGTFLPSIRYTTGGFNNSVLPGDFNRDGKNDLIAIGYWTQGYFFVLLNTTQR